MASRKDTKGRVLYKGESQRNDYYIYQYTDIHRKRRVIYAKDLPELREKERALPSPLPQMIAAESALPTFLTELRPECTLLADLTLFPRG